MTQKEILNEYWRDYLKLERDYLFTQRYLPLDMNNLQIYSDAFWSIMLESNALLDNSFNLYCQLYGKRYNNIKDVKRILEINNPTIINVEIKLYNESINPIKPFKNWFDSEDKILDWWNISSKGKHHKHEISDINTKTYYQNANMLNTIKILAALYSILDLINQKLGGNRFLLPFSSLFSFDYSNIEIIRDGYIETTVNASGGQTLNIVTKN